MGKLVVPPCYKYIAKKLNSPDDRYSFSRHFFEKMSQTGADSDEIMLLYGSLVMPSSVGKLCDYNGVTLTSQAYYEHIMSLSDIPSISCPQYYRNCIKPDNRNNLCQLCELSKSYRNGNYQVECSLLKYIITSRDNLRKFKELGVEGAFRSVFDIASELDCELPGIVQLLDTAYLVIQSQADDVYVPADIKARLEGLVGKITVESTKNTNVKNIQMNNHRALPVTWEMVISDILNVKDLNYDEVCSEVSKIDLSSSKRKKGKKKKPLVESSPLFDYLDNLGDDTVSTKNNNPDVPNKAEDADVSIDEHSINNVDDNSAPDSFIGEPYYDDIPNSIEAPDDIPESAYTHEPAAYEETEMLNGQNGKPEHGQLSEGSEENTSIVHGNYDNTVHEPAETAEQVLNAGEQVDYAQSDNDGDSTSSENIQTTPDHIDDVNGMVNNGKNEDEGKSASDASSDAADAANNREQPTANKIVKKALKYKVPPIKEGELIYSISVNRNTIKGYASSYKNVEPEVFSSLQKSKRLPVEVVYDENGGAYLFMFVRSLGQFVYCPVDSDMPKTIVALFLSKSVIKICYQPYFLYSLLRLYDIRACGIYSICSMDSLLHPEAVIAYYDDFFEVYTGNFKNIMPADSGFKEFDSLLVNMQKYILIHAKQTRSTFDRSEYLKRHSRDEVLGSSFLRIINLKTNDYLFSLEPNGKIIYNQNFELQARHDGFFVTYSVGLEDVGELVLSELYLDALYELSSKGRFRKYNVQLVTITSTAMVMFIGEAEYELITTALQKYFNKYALINHMERFELNVAHQRIYCKSQKSAKQAQIPRTYEQAMDLLITTNDTVTVKESHVVKRNKAKRKGQTQTFKPT